MRNTERTERKVEQPLRKAQELWGRITGDGRRQSKTRDGQGGLREFTEDIKGSVRDTAAQIRNRTGNRNGSAGGEGRSGS